MTTQPIKIVKLVNGDDIISIPKDKILTITNANTDMTKSYHHVAQAYDKEVKVPEKKDFERVRFSNKENEKLNDIFEEEELDDYDDNGTLH